ncbi:hypothetical protein ARMGADRAFT_1040559 [Armillaria gallica]|uniref:Uncharacterized protein n=1 Tax=Armillaria gallica TaxID=47427 RepID=A0A2H3C9J1_ARMGA|nr:hypothetical protein ARMGADRAFT_1040559 [Armillaria gallica]
MTGVATINGQTIFRHQSIELAGRASSIYARSPVMNWYRRKICTVHCQTTLGLNELLFSFSPVLGLQQGLTGLPPLTTIIDLAVHFSPRLSATDAQLDRQFLRILTVLRGMLTGAAGDVRAPKVHSEAGESLTWTFLVWSTTLVQCPITRIITMGTG